MPTIVIKGQQKEYHDPGKVRVIDSGGDMVRIEEVGGKTRYVAKADIKVISGVQVEDRLPDKGTK